MNAYVNANDVSVVVFGGTIVCAPDGQKGLAPYFNASELMTSANLSPERMEAFNTLAGNREAMRSFLAKEGAVSFAGEAEKGTDSIDYQLEVHAPRIRAKIQEASAGSPESKLIMFFFGTDTLDKYGRKIAADKQLKDELKQRGQKLMLCTSMGSLGIEPEHAILLVRGAYKLGQTLNPGEIKAVTPKDQKYSRFFLHDPLDPTFRKWVPSNEKSLRSSGAALFGGPEEGFGLLDRPPVPEPADITLTLPPAVPLTDGNTPEGLFRYAELWKDATLLVDGPPPAKGADSDPFYQTLTKNNLHAVFLNPPDYDHQSKSFALRYSDPDWALALEAAPKSERLMTAKNSRAQDVFIVHCPEEERHQANPIHTEDLPKPVKNPDYLGLHYSPTKPQFANTLHAILLHMSAKTPLYINALACRSASSAVVPPDMLKEMDVSFIYEAGQHHHLKNDPNERLTYSAAREVAKHSRDAGFTENAAVFFQTKLKEEREGKRAAPSR